MFHNKKYTFDDFPGEVWPGPCVFPDYTQAKVRLWWANLVKDFISNGVDGIWNDMNEPVVFKVARQIFFEIAIIISSNGVDFLFNFSGCNENNA